jgi:multisubunit Na+/H+ antiporter MnhB subunit
MSVKIPLMTCNCQPDSGFVQGVVGAVCGIVFIIFAILKVGESTDPPGMTMTLNYGAQWASAALIAVGVLVDIAACGMMFSQHKKSDGVLPAET